MDRVESENTVGAYEAKTRLSELLDRVEKGEEFTISRHGTPVARLTPAKKQSTPEERKRLIEAWISSPNRPTLGGLKIKDLIAEGRK